MFGLDLKTTGKWFVFSIAVGIVAGTGAVAFQFACQLVSHYALEGVAGYTALEPAGEASHFEHAPGTLSFPLLFVVLAAGGLVSGWLVYTFAPEAEGHGTDAAIDAFHRKRGYISPRIPVVKLLASAVTLGTGGSGGREGPIAQIGAGFGSFLATKLKLSARDRRILLAAGMGAGVGAIFRAPLAGALFSSEILYKEEEFESDVIMPTAISSITGYCAFSLSLPKDQQFVPLFGDDLHYVVGSLVELLPLAVLAVILTAVGGIYVKTFYATHRAFKRLRCPAILRPLIGAVGAGAIAALVYQLTSGDPQTLSVLSTGYGTIQHHLERTTDLGIGLLLLIAVGKIVTTSLTIGSGGSGGVFGPSMVIGGCLGGAVGELFHLWMPTVVTQPKAYIIVGMAGFFAGCAHAPISTLIMVSEMTGDYKLLLPVMWVSSLCFLLSRRWTLYEKQLPTRLDSPAHRGDFIVDVLEGFRVEEVYQHGAPVRLIPESMTLDEIVHLLAETDQSYFPVVDDDERIVGIFSTRDVRAYLYDETLWRVAIAKDIMVPDVLTVRPKDDLNTAMRRVTQRNIDEIPVVDDDAPEKLVGMLRRKDIIAFYNQRLAEMKRAREEHE